MSKKFKIIFITFLFLTQIIFPNHVFAVDCPETPPGANLTDDGTVISPKTSKAVIPLWYLECTFQKVIGVVAALAGMTALLIIIYSGFKFITAQGDQKAVASARATLTLAVIGLIMVLVAYFIIDFLAQFTGLNQPTPDVDLRKFIIPKPIP